LSIGCTSEAPVTTGDAGFDPGTDAGVQQGIDAGMRTDGEPGASERVGFLGIGQWYGALGAMPAPGDPPPEQEWYLSASAGFGEAIRISSGCETRATEDACAFERCTDPEGSFTSLPPSSVHLSGGGLDADLAVEGETLVLHRPNGEAPPYPAATGFTFTVGGRGELPSFERTLTSPPLVRLTTFTAPATLDRTRDVELATDRTDAQLRVVLTEFGSAVATNRLTCRFDLATGIPAIPAALLSRFGAGTPVAWTIETETRQSIDVEGWAIELLASTSAVGAGGAPIFGLSVTE
jgi:hypothetical protein